MISRTIEAVEVGGKTLFYEIHIENVEFHILGQTVKTNKWLRFEEWQQIYEQLTKSLSSYPETPLDFTIKSFTVGNYIRVEIELFPGEKCYGELFKLKPENCLPDFLQIRIKQIALGSNLEEIQKVERKSKPFIDEVDKSEKRDTRKRKKKRRSVSLSEYNPVAVKKNPRAKYVPPYKPSKLSPEAQDADEPYSPKPVIDASGQDDYSPYTVSSTDNASSPIIPTYKPSAIINRNSGKVKDDLSRSKTSDNENIDLSSQVPLAVKTDGEDVINDSPTTIDQAEKNTKKKQNRGKRCVSPQGHLSKRPKFSEDLFADYDEEQHETQSKSADDQKLLSRKISRNTCQKSPELQKIESTPSKGTKVKDGGLDESESRQQPVGERRSQRTPIKRFEKCPEYETSDIQKCQKAKSKKSRSKERSESKAKKTSHRTENETPTSSQDCPKQHDKLPPVSRMQALPSIEERQQNHEFYKKQIDTLEKLSNEMNEKNQPPPNVEIVDLNGLKTEELIATYKEFKSQLNKIFAKYKNQKRFCFKQETDDKLYLLILNIIDTARVIAMMDYLQTTYEPNCDGVPTYTDLFMNIMVPEWVLMLFMKRTDLTRDDAINRIKIQRDIDAYNQSLSMEE